MRNGRFLLQALAGGSLASLLATAPAAAQNQTYLDVQGGVGYSTNPDLRLNGKSSGFGRISANGYHSWGNEKSNTSLSAYVENTAYLRGYGNRQLFSVSAANSSRVSETTRVFGTLGFSADFGLQLSSRFFAAPTEAPPVAPVVPDSVVVLVNPDLVALSQRQYRLAGTAGAEFALSPLDTLTASFGAQRAFFKPNNVGINDFNQYDGTLAYQRLVNERLSVGIRTLVNKADYKFGRSVLSYGPQLTANLKLSESLEFGGALGFVRTETDLGGTAPDAKSTDLAFDLSLCRKLQTDRFCARASRRTQSVAIGTSPTSTSASLDYSRRLNARDQVQASLAFVNTDGAGGFVGSKQNFYSAAASYDHKMSLRLSGGVNLVARRYTISGPDPKSDLGASVFIRNRFGSIR